MDKGKPKTSITIRAVFIGLLLIPINSYWHIQMTLVWLMNFPAILTLLFNVIFILFWLIVLNFILKKYLPSSALSQSELIVIYVMLVTSTALSGYDMMQCLISLIGNGTWYATPENEWSELFSRHLPGGLTISDKSILRGFYRGESTLYTIEHIKAWLVPAAIWCSFIVVLLFVMLCINVILRKQWTDREKLAYPIVKLPFEMTVDGGSRAFFRNRLMWIGFGIAAFISILNGLNFFFPSIPSISVKPYSLGRYFTERPWNAMRFLNVSFFPFAIGLGFLMPLDLAVSCWVFYLIWQMQRVFGTYVGWSSMPDFPYATAQVRGVWVGLLLFALWIGRRHFFDVVRKVLGRGANLDDSQEPLGYRTAALGIFLGMGFIIAFCVKAGMSVWVAFAFFSIYFALSTTLTRIRAELGPPAHDMYGSGPDHIMTMFLGTRRLGAQNLTIFSLFYWINREAYRTHPMPHQLEAFKLSYQANMKSRRLVWAIVLASALGALSCFWAFLHSAYKLGAGDRLYGTTWFAREAYSRLATWLHYPSTPNHVEITFAGIGFVFTILMLLMRMRFLWWMLHPVGYAVSGWWIIGRLWFPLFISSIIKWLALKFGGAKGYRRAVPFFLGLILGDFIIGSIWSILGIAFGMRTYVFWGG